jgi:hypothetical protein
MRRSGSRQYRRTKMWPRSSSVNFITNRVRTYRTEQLLDAAEHKSVFGRRQTLAFPAPSEMLQPRLRHCVSSHFVVGLCAG